MAEGLLFSLADGIIKSLGSLALQELGLLWGVKDELGKLQNTVSAIKAVLLDAEEKLAAGDNAVKHWLDRLSDVVYEADDVLDDFSTEGLLREMKTRGMKAKQVRIFLSKSNQLAYGWKMGHKIKAIREKLDAIEADRKFHLEKRYIEPRVIVTRKRGDSHSCVRAEEVFGRVDDTKAVLELLMDSTIEENISILPIVGIGGLGKTTLAQCIFNDEKIQRSFEVRLWVCVSDNFEVKTIVENIIESATKKKQETVEMETLVNHLRKEIDEKRYFLVLDDLWNDDSERWLSLKTLLMGGARGSRILVTTRSVKVARLIRTYEPYFLKGLDKNQSWSLFKHLAFEKGQEPKNSSIREIGTEIVDKCAGVPLAIRTMGALMYFKNPETEWSSFKGKELSKISQKENDILPTLKLSYDQLPSHLRPCFAYCSLFPKDYCFEKSTLVNLWIAQGFIKLSNENQYFEDVGNEYFMDLLWRSFFQEAEINEFGDVIRCKMHDLMHDLAISVAGSLITRLDDEKKVIDEKTRHLSLQEGLFHVVPKLNASRMRSIIFPSGTSSGREICQLTWDTIFSSLKAARTLVLCGSHELCVVPSSIGKLKHLRYLCLCRNRGIKKLPDSVTSLQNLRTLRLSRCYSLEEWPRNIKNLANLAHLEIEHCGSLTHMPRGLGQMTNLRTLSEFVVHSGSLSEESGGLKELNRLNDLRGNLVIRGLRHGKDMELEYSAANLKGKQYLQSLDLRWLSGEDFNDDEQQLESFQPHPNLKKLYLEGYGASRFPNWLLSLTNLVDFKLVWCTRLQYLPAALSQLPSLKCLSLQCLNDLEYISDSGGGSEFSSSSSSRPIAFFPSLKEIFFFDCGNFKGWCTRRDSSKMTKVTPMMKPPLFPSFPLLSKLRIGDCPVLTSMPTFPHLEELNLSNASWNVVQQTMMIHAAAPQNPSTAVASSTIASSSSTPLSKLKSLSLDYIHDLRSLPEEGLRNLTSLQYLSISSCDRLQTLSRGIYHLSALQELYVGELDLRTDKDGMHWKGLKCLVSLKFWYLPELKSLPSGLQHVTTLRKLEISHCSSLMAIPEWIQNWTSLEQFAIERCGSLTRLPEGMRCLTSLQSLKIRECPLLFQRCQSNEGEDWPKIAHIPKLDLK